MPTMLTDEMKAIPQSVQHTPAAPPRKPPAKRTYQEDEINAFLSQDIIGDKKQSVPLALAIFHETTTAAFESYFPERENASKFLKMINTWWVICNSKEMSHPNPLGNAVRVGDGKTDFLEALADWLEKWHDDCPAFTLTSKTSYALVLTLRAQSGLIKELLSEGYHFVMTSRLQSDPIDRFSPRLTFAVQNITIGD